MYRLTFLLIFSVFFLFGFSCQLGIGKTDKPSNTPDPIINITVSGTVKSISNGLPIEGADIVTNNTTATTDSDGKFSIECTNENSIKITRNGYAAFQKPLGNFSASCSNVEFYLKPVDIQVIIDPTNDSKITTKDGASITLPKLEGINEELIVSLTSYNVNTDEINCVPGDFNAITDTGSNTTIISQGMIDVSIIGMNSNTPYTLNGLGTYDIVIPITGNISTAPSSIALWYFDTDSCKWIENGTLTRDGNFYKGSVTHFTTWNADYKGNVTSISGLIIDPAENESYIIKLFSPGFMREFYESEKSFSIINIPQNTAMRIEITKISNGEIWSKDFTTNNSSNNLNLGNFPDEFYVPEVTGLVAFVNDNDINLSWTGEPAGIRNIEITYGPIGSSDTTTVIVDPGIMTYQINDLENDVYSITVKTILNDDRKSTGLIKRAVIGRACVLTINITGNETGRVLVKLNGDTAGFYVYYNSPSFEFSTNSTIELEGLIDNNIGYFNFWQWLTFSSEENPITFTNIVEDLEIDAVFGRPY